MSGIRLRGCRYSGNTILSNCFIDNYMSDANEAQIKIYLYLMRCIEADEAVSVSSIADRFNYTEREVLRSLLYWEKKGIISLVLDDDHNVSEIILNDPQEMSAEIPAQTPSDAVISSKPSYTMKELKDFRNRSDIRQLVFAAEQYLGKTLSAAEMKSILYMSEVLHFPADLIEYLIEYCVDKGKNSMKYIEQTAFAWSDEGVTDISSAREHTRKYNQDCYSVLKEFGLSGRDPVKSEADFVDAWKNEYGFSMDIVIEAVRRTMAAIAKPSFSYTDSIIRRWKAAGVKDISDINKLDSIRKDKLSAERVTHIYNSSSTSSSPIAPRGNKFRNFEERRNNYDELEKELLKN